MPDRVLPQLTVFLFPYSHSTCGSNICSWKISTRSGYKIVRTCYMGWQIFSWKFFDFGTEKTKWCLGKSYWSKVWHRWFEVRFSQIKWTWNTTYSYTWVHYGPIGGSFFAHWKIIQLAVFEGRHLVLVYVIRSGSKKSSCRICLFSVLGTPKV